MKNKIKNFMKIIINASIFAMLAFVFFPINTLADDAAEDLTETLECTSNNGVWPGAVADDNPISYWYTNKAANKYLLFETSYVSKPLQLEEMIFEIGAVGYTPIMAHPERYRYIKDPLKEYTRLKELGVLFQVNLNSLGGHYGKSAKHLADFLNKEGMIDFLGSDVHHLKQVKTLGHIFQSEDYSTVFENNTIRNHELA